jgi:hypothetical protein
MPFYFKPASDGRGDKHPGRKHGRIGHGADATTPLREKIFFFMAARKQGASPKGRASPCDLAGKGGGVKGVEGG